MLIGLALNELHCCNRTKEKNSRYSQCMYSKPTHSKNWISGRGSICRHDNINSSLLLMDVSQKAARQNGMEVLCP